MELKKAMNIIETAENGYMISFEKQNGSILISDHFPDKHAGEDLINNLDEAWKLAERFAVAVKKNGLDYYNIYVVDNNFKPVSNYKEKKLNRL